MILGICSVLLRALPKISPKPLLRGWGVRRSGLEGPWEGAGRIWGERVAALRLGRTRWA